MADQNKKKNGPRHPYLRCKKAVTKEHKSVQCQTCEFWVHVECQGIPDELFNVLAHPEDYGGVCWNCDSCLASSYRVMKTVKAYEDRIKNVEQTVSKTAMDLRRVDDTVAELKKELEAEKQKNREAEKKREEKFVTREEYREREARKLNIIMHRVKEPSDQARTAEDRKAEDTTECVKIFRALGLEDEAKQGIKHCRRVGERGTEPRPLVVVIRSEDTRTKMLEKARNLRETEYKEVGIVPDLTVGQRREEQEMVEEAERRNEEELTDEDRAKNLHWLVVGQRGAKLIIKGVKRDQQQTWRRGAEPYRGGRRTSAARGGLTRPTGIGRATGANATNLGQPALQPPARTRLGSKRQRTDGAGEEEEEDLDMEAEAEEGLRSPPKKK